MVKMPEEVIKSFESEMVKSFGTASKDGVPNICLMGFVQVLDAETVLLGDLMWKITADNLAENNKGCIVTFAPPMTSYLVKGTVELLTEGPIFDNLAKVVDEKMPGNVPKHAALLHVEEVYNSIPGPDNGKKLA